MAGNIFSQNPPDSFINKGASKIAGFAKGAANAATTALDIDASGYVDISDIITIAMGVPATYIDRDVFLREEFAQRGYSQATCEMIVGFTPAIAGVKRAVIDDAAEKIVEAETNYASNATLISTDSVEKGRFPLTGIPAIVVRDYAYMLHAAQKLLYLYDFPPIVTYDNEGIITQESMQLLILCLGVMEGVKGADTVLKMAADGFSKEVELRLVAKALHSGKLQAINHNIALHFSNKLSTDLVGGLFKSVPIAGAIIGGGVTHLSFGVCCKRLLDALKG